jgi:hypothetical protein
VLGVGYMLYSLHVCVCVWGMSDSTTASHNPSSSYFLVIGRFLLFLVVF